MLKNEYLNWNSVCLAMAKVNDKSRKTTKLIWIWANSQEVKKECLTQTLAVITNSFLFSAFSFEKHLIQ